MEGRARSARGGVNVENGSGESSDVPFVRHDVKRWFGASESYLLVRFAILRLLGVVYAVAFLVSALQGPPLIGEDGLLPAGAFLERVREAIGLDEAWWRLPTLFWFGFSDSALRASSWLGVALSAAVALGATNAALQLVLWGLYFSIVQVGQRFYGYGWESQLLETGFLSVFLCPLRSVHPLAKAPPFVVVLLARWLIARVMLGAGLIKLRGDACWTELTCLDFHYETQPIPNPLSPYFHAMPAWFHRGGVLFNHAVEIGGPFLAFGPRRARLIAGLLFIVFQAVLIASGNLSFLNWLTIVPALACFDDRVLVRLFPASWIERTETHRPASTVHRRAAIAYAVVVAVLSINPLLNFFSPEQAMNRSFDPLHLVNTYGAFGSVGKVRHEVILEGTSAPTIDEHTEWKTYELPCKPGDVHRRPCWISPYHRRLDWQMWFAALNPPGREPWILHLIEKLLEGDRSVMGLFANDPFAARPPTWVRAQFYRYELLSPWSSESAYWRRELVGPYLPPLARDDPALADFLRQHGLR
jgi:hypothetical protein